MNRDYENSYYEMNELLSIVAKLAERYTSYESTSVTYEKAEQLMGAVLYCIQEENIQQTDCVHGREYDGIYQKIDAICEKRRIWGEQGAWEEGRKRTEDEGTGADSKDIKKITPVKAQSAQQAYEAGLARVEKKVRAALDLYNALMSRFDSYGNRCLYDTMVKGIPDFFKWYDIRYAPQDTILMLDYPVLRDLSAYSGIDRIYEYLKCIWLEQEFLSSFPKEYVMEVLLRFHPLYEEMIENICEIVYRAADCFGMRDDASL